MNFGNAIQRNEAVPAATRADASLISSSTPKAGDPCVYAATK